MKKRLISLLIGLFVACGLILVPLGSAQAEAPGNIMFNTLCSSQTYLTVMWKNSYSGYVYNDPVYPCALEGEGAQNAGGIAQNTTSEPLAFLLTYGWCGNFRVNSGPFGQDFHGSGSGPSNGLWVSVYPGSGYYGTWAVHAQAWRC